MSNEIENLTEAAQPITLGLVERGADIHDAARFGAMFAVFMDQNAGKIAAAIAAGEDRDAVIAEALESFRRDASKAWNR